MIQLQSLLTVSFLVATVANSQAADSLFERDVLPILTKQCLGCHGGLRQKGKLDLRTIPAMLKGGRSGKVIESGNVAQSELWTRIDSDEMPPNEEKLSAKEKAIIKQWIAAGLPTVAQQQKYAKPLLPADKKHEPMKVAKTIDEHIQRQLESQQLKPAENSDDAEFLRRLYLDLTGRVPTAEQAREFLDSKDLDKRAKLIDTLLDTSEFGEQFGRTWRQWICPPELPSDGNSGKQPHREAQKLGEWIGERVARGEGWDKITREILTVNGEIKKNPQMIFFGLVGQGGKITPNGSARAVASLFMGVQLQCAECHDDPYRDWAQNEHWALAGFFSQTKGDFKTISEDKPKKKAEVVIPKTAFLNAGTKVPVAFLRDEKSLPKKGPLRVEFAAWLTRKENPFFARAFANRLWFYFFAKGIVNPVDDIRELNPPSHPGLLQLLTNEFAASNFDMKHLIRCICNSKSYQRTSRVQAGTDETTIAKLTKQFGRMPLRVMNADVLLDSLKLAYGDPKLDLRAIDPKDGNSSGESAPVADVYLEFLRQFGTNEDDTTDFTHGIPQMLTFLNHPRLMKGSKSLEEYLKAKPSPTPEQTIDWLYLSTLSRRPTKEEQTEALSYLENKEDHSRAYLGILWMLVNRSEYLLIR